MGRLSSLQALRAVAALGVVCDHAIYTLIEKNGLSRSLETLAIAAGQFGVCLFFAISGFIMIYTTGKEHARPGAASRFLCRRLARVVPLYWLTLMVYAAKLALQGTPPSIGEMTQSLLFVPYTNAAGLQQPVYGLGWTLNYEMFFYALFAAALSFRQSMSVLVIGTAFLVLLVTRHAFEWTIGSPQFDVIYGFWADPIVLFFLIGMTIGLVRSWIGPSVTSGVSMTQSLGLVLVIAVGLCVAAMGGAALPSGSLWMMAGVAMSLVAAAFQGDGDATTGWRRVMSRIGDASYSIYLTHSFLIGPSARVWALVFGAGAWPLFVAAMVIGATVLGLLVHRWIEAPMTAYALRFVPRAKPPTAPVQRKLLVVQ